jgi:hypothetical protein
VDVVLFGRWWGDEEEGETEGRWAEAADQRKRGARVSRRISNWGLKEGKWTRKEGLEPVHGEKGGKGGARLLRDCLQEDDKEEPGWGSVVVRVDTLS